jgi:hypothetical protein
LVPGDGVLRHELEQVVQEVAVAEKTVLVRREGERGGGEGKAEVERGGDRHAGVRDRVAADGVDFKVGGSELLEGVEALGAAPSVDEEDVGSDGLESEELDAQGGFFDVLVAGNYGADLVVPRFARDDAFPDLGFVGGGDRDGGLHGSGLAGWWVGFGWWVGSGRDVAGPAAGEFDGAVREGGSDCVLRGRDADHVEDSAGERTVG